MPTRPIALALVFGLGLGLAGCATLDHGVIDDVPVVTDPPGASVSASTGTICTSPCTVSGPRRETFTITIAKAGYTTQTVVSESKPNDAAIAAASSPQATPDALGRVIDVQDGSYDTHVPKTVVVKLEAAP